MIISLMMLSAIKASAIAVPVVKSGFDWVMLLKDVGVPLVGAFLGYLGGRKSATEKKKSEFETLSQELEAFKNYRQLLIDDNNSLIKELREMKTQMSEMKEQLKDLAKNNCYNFPYCKNKKQL